MATTTFGVNSNEAVKLWSKLLMMEVDKALEMAPLIGRDKNSPILLINEMQKSAGDRVRTHMLGQLVGEGVSEGETLYGNEESMATYTDDLVINELYHATEVKGETTIDTQRVLHNYRNYARDLLRDWYATRISNAFFMHAAGYLGSSITLEGTNYSLLNSAVKNKFTLFNDPIAATNTIRPGGEANDQSMDSADVFSLALIDKAKTLAMTANPRIRPVRVGGRNKYVMYIHPYQTYQLRTQTGENSWADFSKRGPEHKERIYEGAIGEYNGVILREHEHVAPGFNASTNAEITAVRRAVLLGAGACAIAYGRGSGPNRYSWREEEKDYRRTLGVGCGAILGMKKCQFNSKDWGTVVVSTYSPNPNA